ncbi:aromatic amino acid ammonia-lyase [Arcicella sp. LKC2W]|uniref:HAL/PAL/TAL family ammonia-lyase n=1 Tax=Arcicella sp. LKC2W TaxID=2984198 RepID=UPI002B1FFE79|nr:aromatic amino acid ammonia-lyase [Arcicella sp. LKC2W]MEA5460843.1 aromatic amino acid ammonia-lyase [Arcicella sp. LKC2W]
MKITIGNDHLTLEDFKKILFEDANIEIGNKATKRVEKCYNFLADFTKNKLIYGINTGFGPMAQYRIEEEEQTQLQYNLIRSHTTGMGNAISPIFVKSLMVARLNTLLKGYSGVHPELVELLCEYINNDVLPVIYEHGSVGASGDLVQLSHLALSLIGEGKVSDLKGNIQNTEVVIQDLGLEPFKIRLREALALMNGTSAMTGIGIVNAIHAQNLMNWSILASAMIVELVESFDDHYSYELNAVKLHEGQAHVAKKMRSVLKDSTLVRNRREHHYEKKVTVNVLKEKMQEYYSIRCVPQILGPIHDTIEQVINVLIAEVNSVNDNPIVDAERGDVYHGGNFHGDYVSLEMDKLKTAITKLSMLSERQLNYLLNDKLNQILPPFVNLGKLGFNLGMQGAQFVATSTVAENQTLSFPMYVHSIPNNNDNQDIVSMGTNAALLASKVIENTFQILAVEFLTIIQAVDYLGFEDKLSSCSQRVYQQLRELVPVFSNDTIMYPKIGAVKDYLYTTTIDITSKGCKMVNAEEANTEIEMEVECCPV